MAIDVTFLIVTFKSGESIHKCIDLIPKKYPVLVIENSADNFFKGDLEEKYNNVKCTLSGENLGFGKASNIGLNLVKSKYAFLINPDTLITSNTIEQLIHYAEKINDFALLSPVMADEEDKNYRIYKKKLLPINQSEYLEVDFIKGFAMFFNMSKFKSISFFDEKIFLYFEEDDLCKRVRNLNQKIYVIFSSKITHAGGQSHNKEFNEEIDLSRHWHHMWSYYYYNKKHFTFLYALLITFHKVIFYSLKILFYIFLFNKNKKKYKQRLSGLINSYIGKSSWYRPKI
jgi:N-acetylglucosaminyl-diphospho-decaprenol L-rhamnosyltransferase